MKLRVLTKKVILRRNIYGIPIEVQHRKYLYKWTLTGRKYLGIKETRDYDGKKWIGAETILYKNTKKVICTFVNCMELATSFNDQQVTYILKNIITEPDKYELI